MNKIRRRRIGLFIILTFVIVEICISMLTTIKINDFYKEINNSSQSHWAGYSKTGVYFQIFFDTDENSIFKALVEGIPSLIFLIPAIVYAFNKKQNSKIIRKWPYIILIIVFALWILYFALFKITWFNFVSKIINWTSFNDLPNKVQNVINNIKKQYNSIKLFSILNVVLAILQIGIISYLLILTIKIQNLNNMEFSNKVKSFKRKNNYLA